MKTAGKHTKGPWQLGTIISIGKDDGAAFSIMAGHKTVCGFEYEPCEADCELMENSEANARLMVKAPDMRELLEDIRAAWVRTDSGKDVAFANTMRRLNEILKEV